MTKFADLHIHTHFSDSTASPQEVAEEAVHKEIGCIAITDHDTIDGIDPTIAAAKGLSSSNGGLEVLSGIELSTSIEGKDVHMLGYLVDHHHPRLTEQIKKFQDSRMDRIREMLKKLKGMGVDNITFEEVAARTRSNSIGRPHLAALLKEKGWVSNIAQAFAKYLGDGCRAYVPKFNQTPFEGIDLIRECGGVAVLAHPMITNKDEMIPKMAEAGLGGIEVYYANCPINIVHYYEGIARKHKLVMTGGSDAHGRAKPNTHIGKAKIPYELVEQLKDRAGAKK